MTGCGGVKVVSPEAGNSSQKAEFEKIKTPEDEKVVLNIVDWSDSTKDAREKLNEQFMKDHPNVTVNYTTLTQAQFNETMLSGIRAGGMVSSDESIFGRRFLCADPAGISM